MSTAVMRYPDRYELPLRARSVSRVYVDSGFDLQFFDDAGSTGVRIENPLAVVTENPRPMPRKDGREEPAFGKIIVSSTALRKGKLLQVVFAPGVRFWVEPHIEGEGWGPYGIQGQIILCLPGTEMAIWFGRSRQDSLSVMADAGAREKRAAAHSAIIE